MSVEWAGWLSSAVLILTMLVQVAKERKSGQAKGVSRWLYIGQLAAGIGFVYYSWMVRNWVFVVTNSLLLAINVFGLFVHFSVRRGGDIAEGAVDGAV